MPSVYKKPQGQFLFQPRQAHQHLKRLALETNLQRLLHHYQIVGIFHPTLSDSAGWGMVWWAGSFESILDRRGRLSYIFFAIIRSKLQDVLALTGKKAIISIT